MNRQISRILAVGALVVCAVISVHAEAPLQDLDIEDLRAQAADYRHKAALLRQRIGLRERDISKAQSLADQIVGNAQAQAQAREQAAIDEQNRAANASATMGGLASALGAIGGGGWVKDAVASGMRNAGANAVNSAAADAQAAQNANAAELQQADAAAAPLREQAKNLEGEKKKLALKADQYESLADAKDMLIAAETLRLQAADNIKNADKVSGAITALQNTVQNMDIW
jgi:hypothetical protein